MPGDLSYEDVLHEVKRQQEKRLLLNPLEHSIEGELGDLHVYGC